MGAISFLIYLIILACLLWLLAWVLAQTSLAQPVRVIIVVLAAVAVLAYLLPRSGLLAL